MSKGPKVEKNLMNIKCVQTLLKQHGMNVGGTDHGKCQRHALVTRGKLLLGAGGGTRTPTALRQTDFLTSCDFRRPGRCRGCGLDYPFTLAERFRCRPSSLYTFPAAGRAWLGIAIRQVLPNLSGSAPAVSGRALKFPLSPSRLPIPPRPHCKRVIGSAALPAKFAADVFRQVCASLPCVRAHAIQSRMPVAEFTAPTRSTPCSRPPCDGTVQAVAHHGMQCIWCPKRDSNSHDRSRGILSPLRLPIPPLGHGDFPIPAGLAGQQAEEPRQALARPAAGNPARDAEQRIRKAAFPRQALSEQLRKYERQTWKTRSPLFRRQRSGARGPAAETHPEQRAEREADQRLERSDDQPVPGRIPIAYRGC